MASQTFVELSSATQLALPLDITITVLGILSLILNSFLLYIVYQHAFGPNRFKLSFGFQLIILMAITDIITSTSNISSYIIRSLSKEDIVAAKSTYCSIFGFLDIYLSGQSGLTTSLLATERYLIVVKGTTFKPKLGWAMLIMTNLIFGGLFFMNSLNADYVPDPTHTYCLPYGTAISELAEYTTGLLFYLPLIVLSFCYTSIFYTCYYRNSALCAQGFPASRIAFRALLLTFVYCSCYTPNVVFYSQYLITGLYPIGLFVGGPITVNLTLVLNPILVILLHQQFFNMVVELIYPKSKDHTRLEFTIG